VKKLQEAIARAVEDAFIQGAEQVINEMGLDNSIATLWAYPAKIKQQQHSIANAQRNLEEAKMNLETAKADIMAAINAEVNGQGKPVFSNEKAREAEFIRRARTSQEYQEALDAYRDAEEKFNEAKFELEKLLNEFTVHKAVLSALTAKINFLAGNTKI
jgi:chromosome segregation ATPase